MKTKITLLCLGISWLSTFISPLQAINKPENFKTNYSSNKKIVDLPPTVVITAPAAGASFGIGSTVSVTANASDPSGLVDSVQFFVDGILIGTDKVVPFEASFTMQFGSHTIMAKAIDNDGQSATDSITIQMANPPGLEKITVEKYYVSNSADAAQADADIDQYNDENGTNLPHGALPYGSVTYRFYADLLPGYRILSVYADGTKNQSLKFTTTTNFYNHTMGSITPVPGTTKAFIKNNLLALDSYVSLGAVATGQYGILKTEDNGAANNITTSANSAGVLLNSSPDMGIALTTQDGMIAATGAVSPAFLGFSNAIEAVFKDGSVLSNQFDLTDGIYYTTVGAHGPVPATNKVLIAQVTTNGTLHYELNLLLQKDSEPGQYFVAKNPGAGDIVVPSLQGTIINIPANIPPVVSITSPENNQNVIQGTNFEITANASDPGDVVTFVEFFVDGLSIGVDNTAPFKVTYSAALGVHSITAKATDSGGLQAISNPLIIHSVNSIPEVNITSPAQNNQYYVNTLIPISANASDSFSNIDSVEFFVDGISKGTDKTNQYSISYIGTAGIHYLSAKATNHQGVSAFSIPVKISVIDPSAVNGLEKIVVEKYYVSNAADSIQANNDIDQFNSENGTTIAHGALPVGSVTYRFYADLLPGYKLLSVYADSLKNQPLKFHTSTSFYNHPFGFFTPVPGTTKASLKNNLLALDSYLSLGGVATGQYGILKADDDGALNNVTTAANPNAVLLNNTASMGFPLTSRDGMIGGSGILTPAFPDFTANAFAAFTDGSVTANTLLVKEGAMNNATGATGPIAAANKILIAQVTTDGILNYELNVLLVAPDGTLISFAAHAKQNEFSHPSLTGTLNPDSQPYGIKTIADNCSNSSFCLPIVANDNVKDVIGYDIVLSYDKTKVHPTGNVTLKNELINLNYASSILHDDSTSGEINISIFLNINAPQNATFNGSGELMCIEFSKDPSLFGVDSALFHISSLQESYANGVGVKGVDAGQFVAKQNTLFNGKLQFWTDHNRIKLGSIYGSNLNCGNKSSLVTQADTSGHFTYDVTNGASIIIDRPIYTSNVQPFINGFDASLGHKVLLNDLTFIPSIYQALALDVNLDGVISAGDISQLNQRSVKTIYEFKQKWNYNSDGTSNGQPSKHWLFVDDSLLSGSAYKISTTYPSNDGLGYSKHKVPVVPFCLSAPTPSGSCHVYEQTAYTGILLGDVDGNYDSVSAGGQTIRLDNANELIYLNLNQAVAGNGYMDIPVSFVSSQKIVSLDFAAQYNPQFTFEKIVNPLKNLTDAMANYSSDDHTLRFTSNSNEPYENNKTIVYIRLLTSGQYISSSDFNGLAGYLNGKEVAMEIRGNTSTGISTSDSKNTIAIYPNPASSVLNIVTSEEKAVVELMDLRGRQIMTAVTANANEKLEINTENISSGTYLLKVYNDHFISTQRIVIENKN